MDATVVFPGPNVGGSLSGWVSEIGGCIPILGRVALVNGAKRGACRVL